MSAATMRSLSASAPTLILYHARNVRMGSALGPSGVDTPRLSIARQAWRSPADQSRRAPRRHCGFQLRQTDA